MTTPVKQLLEQRRDAHPVRLTMRHGYPSGDYEGVRQICECGSPWPCPDRVALDAALASLTEIAKHLEAIRDEHHDFKRPAMERLDAADAHAAAALALLVGGIDG